MGPRPTAVAFGTLTGLALCLVTAAQKPLLLFALQCGVHYLFVPMLAVSLWMYCLGMAAQAIWLEVQEWQRITSDPHLHYRID